MDYLIEFEERLSGTSALDELANVATSWLKLEQIGKGLLCIKAKQVAPHGTYIAWSAKTFGVERRTISKWVKVAKSYQAGKLDIASKNYTALAEETGVDTGRTQHPKVAPEQPLPDETGEQPKAKTIKNDAALQEQKEKRDDKTREAAGAKKKTNKRRPPRKIRPDQIYTETFRKAYEKFERELAGCRFGGWKDTTQEAAQLFIHSLAGIAGLKTNYEPSERKNKTGAIAD